MNFQILLQAFCFAGDYFLSNHFILILKCTYLIRYKLSDQTYRNLWKFSPNHSIFLLSSQKQGLLVMKIWLQKERLSI